LTLTPVRFQKEHLTYKLVVNNNIITKDAKQYPEELTFLDYLENALLGRKHSPVLTKFFTVEVHYISFVPSVIFTN
jgi:hypothetical protein